MWGAVFYLETRQNVKVVVKNVKIFRVALLLVVANQEYNDSRRRTKIRVAAMIPISLPLTGCPSPD